MLVRSFKLGFYENFKNISLANKPLICQLEVKFYTALKLSI